MGFLVHIAQRTVWMTAEREKIEGLSVCVLSIVEPPLSILNMEKLQVKYLSPL